MASYRYSYIAILALLPACFAGVCSMGEIAIGKTSTTAKGPGGVITIRQGFMMDNDCNVFAQSSQNSVPISSVFNGGSMVCGPYDGKAAVQCDATGNPTTATDTNGNTWSCHGTSDTGCNSKNHEIIACCDVTAHASRRRSVSFAKEA